jgi:hypothetical protein
MEKDERDEGSGKVEAYLGVSDEGFRAATEAAVVAYEEAHGGPPPEPVKLRVLDMYVTVHNPIRDYGVVLGIPGPGG